MFNDMNQKHLKPLSKYAQRVFNEPVAHTSIHQFIKPPNNYENNATKTTAFCSPCVGCFVESPSLWKDPVACDGRRSVSSVIDNVDSPISSKCRAQNVAPSFDLDVDDILNLSPCGGSFQRVPDCGKKRKLDIGSASLHQNSAAAVDDKGMCPDVTTVNQNRGYGSCRTEDQTKPRNLCVSANQQLPRAAWRQLHLDCRDVREEFLSESFQVAETESGQHSSVLDLKVVMSGRPSTELAGSPSRGSVDDLWRVGLTMLTEDAIESPLQVKVNKTQKDYQPCAFCRKCSQTACLLLFFCNVLFLAQVRSVVIKKKDSCAMHSSPRSFYTTRGSPPPV